MICPNCGKELAEAYRFCTACGAKLDEPIYDSEEDVTSRSENVERFMSLFEPSDYENEETVILDYLDESEESVSGEYAAEDSYVEEDSFAEEEPDEDEAVEDAYDTFENEETVILQDFEKQEDFTEEEAAVTAEEPESEDSEADRIMHEYTTELRMEDAPDYEFERRVPVHKAAPSQYEQDTAYINHLRALKQLMDDGIITEDEFVRKKQQILGI